MTIAISCNLSDGVILGADSAISVEGAVGMPDGAQQKGILKVYKTAEKLFKLSKHIGILAFGLGMIGTRSIGSYISEFELKTHQEIADSESLLDICKKLETFFNNKYLEIIKPVLEKHLGKEFDSIPDNMKPKLGFQVAGYSRKSPLSEVWRINIPTKEDTGGIQLRKQGQFGSNWSGMVEPLTRLIKGYDPNLLSSLIDLFVKKYNIQIDQDLKGEIDNLVHRFEGRILYDAMPIQESIDHVKHLLDVVIHNTRFVIGAPICDAPIRIAVITSQEGFRFINEPKFSINI